MLLDPKKENLTQPIKITNGVSDSNITGYKDKQCYTESITSRVTIRVFCPAHFKDLEDRNNHFCTATLDLRLTFQSVLLTSSLKSDRHRCMLIMITLMSPWQQLYYVNLGFPDTFFKVHRFFFPQFILLLRGFRDRSVLRIQEDHPE